MTMRTTVLLRLGLLVASLSLLVGCGPRWLVVRQTVPDPLVQRPQFAVEAIRFDNLLVGGKTEGEYLAGKEQDQRGKWQADKQAMAEGFAAALAAAGEGLAIGPLVPEGSIVRPVVTFIEPGFYAGIAAGATEVRMTVQILDARGTVLDEIEVHSRIAATMGTAAVGTRLRDAADDLGHVVAGYLRTRVFPG
jgi:hypothetical protein